ncbi:MAG: hypothetical protein NC092_14345 [Butyrivibrio sp.]|nr:hypothetical protein [Butyrivibrio sp.]
MIKIKGLPKDSFQTYVEEFCDDIFNKGANGALIPLEVARVIRNMSDYPCDGGMLKSEESDIKAYLENSKAEGLACTKENLLDSINRKINYEGRKLTEVVFEEGRFEDWVKKQIEELNDGKNINAPFPEQIEIHVNDRDLALDIPDYIGAIVDTRGIDTYKGSNWWREDISDSICKKNSISIMCDGVSALGAEDKIRGLLEHILTLEGEDCFHRIFLLGLERGNEIIQSNDAEGSYENGIKIKRNEACGRMASIKIPFDKEHIYFYGALSGIDYHSQSGKISEVDELVRQEAKQKFWDWLRARLEAMCQKFDMEIDKLTQNLECLEQGRLPEDITPSYNAMENIVENLKIIRKEPKTTLPNKIREMENYHAGIVRGCVNRNGRYERLDLYNNLVYQAGANIFQEECETGKEALLMDLTKICKPENEFWQIVIDALEREIKGRYGAYYKESCEYYRECFSQSMENNHGLWERLRRYWGESSGGYREKVIKNIIAEMEKEKIEDKIKEKDLCADYIDDVSETLDFYLNRNE